MMAMVKKRRGIIGGINEKLKALQVSVPNSNKTDKASMLDEAIEYLKQFQPKVRLSNDGDGQKETCIRSTLQTMYMSYSEHHKQHFSRLLILRMRMKIGKSLSKWRM